MSNRWSHHKNFEKLNFYNKISCFELIKFITEDTKVEHTNITTIYKDNQIKCQVIRLRFDRHGVELKARVSATLSSNGIRKMA